ncbi:hypothetical protein Q7O_001169 [Pectobacterium carotovorum subsp. carotovorum PCCS1]|nr:hypothetical protein [Pectobacterium carotovorum subsp. carotovorum PCCS1]
MANKEPFFISFPDFFVRPYPTASIIDLQTLMSGEYHLM